MPVNGSTEDEPGRNPGPLQQHPVSNVTYVLAVARDRFKGVIIFKGVEMRHLRT